MSPLLINRVHPSHHEQTGLISGQFDNETYRLQYSVQLKYPFLFNRFTGILVPLDIINPQRVPIWITLWGLTVIIIFYDC